MLIEGCTTNAPIGRARLLPGQLGRSLALPVRRYRNAAVNSQASVSSVMASGLLCSTYDTRVTPIKLRS